MRTLALQKIALCLLFYCNFCFPSIAHAQIEPPEPLPNYDELFEAVFGESDLLRRATSTSFTSTLPIATTLIEPYQNLAAGGYGFLVDWDPGDSYPTGTILHPALDYNLGGGTADAHQPVIAPGPGQVAYAGWLSDTWGGVVAQQIRLRGGEHIWVFVAHLGIDGTVPASVGSSVTAHDDILVEADTLVVQEEVLGYLAPGVASGNLREIDWGSHLHWEVRHIDHNKWNVGLWPGWNQPLATYLERVVHPAMFMGSYNSENVRLYEGIYLGHDAYAAIQRPQESVAADPRRQTSAFGTGLHNLPIGFQAHSMVVPAGLQVEVFSEVNGEGVSRIFTNPVMNFDSIGELNWGSSNTSGKSDALGFAPKSVLVALLDNPASPTLTPSPQPSLIPSPTATETIAPTQTPIDTSTPTPTATNTLIPTVTSLTATATNFYTPTPSTNTPAPSTTDVVTPTGTPLLTITPTSTALLTATLAPALVFTNTPAYVPSPTLTATFTETVSLRPTPSATATPSSTVTYLPTEVSLTLTTTEAISMPTATVTYTSTPSAMPSVTTEPTDSAIAAPTATTAPAPVSRDATSPSPTPIPTEVIQQEADELEGGTAELPLCHPSETDCGANHAKAGQIFLPFMAGPLSSR